MRQLIETNKIIVQVGKINRNYSKIGRATCYITFLLGIFYIIVTIFGFVSLNSPNEPIRDPFFTIMELLTILIATLMSINMAIVHNYAQSKYKIYSFISVCFMFLMTGITSSVHFVVLIMSNQLEEKQLSELIFFFSFKWPSVVYILDILAWDWFFPLSLLFAIPVFNNIRTGRTLQILMLISGIMSLVGLIGVPFGNMQIRNIGIIGYALLSPFVFLLIGIILGRNTTEKKRRTTSVTSK